MNASKKALRDQPVEASEAVVDLEIWVRRGCALVVASVAAYASYVHQRSFALQGGADATSAALWPLSVDGLLLLATVGLLKPARHASRRARSVVWMAFMLGIGVSLAANIAAAPALAWKPVLVAGWPPVALLFSVELLAHRSGDREPTETSPRDQDASSVPAQRDRTRDQRDKSAQRDTHAKDKGVAVGAQASTSAVATGTPAQPKAEATAEQVMWKHFQQQRATGRMPTGAELDRVAGTNNYGRAVLARWRQSGRIPAAQEETPANGFVIPGKGGARG